MVEENIVELNVTCNDNNYVMEDILVLDRQSTKRYVFEIYKECVKRK